MRGRRGAALFVAVALPARQGASVGHLNGVARLIAALGERRARWQEHQPEQQTGSAPPSDA
jgi:hypothetical protein